MFFPGEIAVIRKNVVDCLPEFWGMEVEVGHGPNVMHYWRGHDTSGPPDITGPAYWVKAPDGRDGWVLAQSLEKRKPPREPTVSWDDVPLWNPVKCWVE